MWTGLLVETCQRKLNRIEKRYRGGHARHSVQKNVVFIWVHMFVMVMPSTQLPRLVTPKLNGLLAMAEYCPMQCRNDVSEG